MGRTKKTVNFEELLTEAVIRRLAWRATLRARSIRAEARPLWQQKKQHAELKFRASQFDDLAVMLRELQAPEAPAFPTVDLKLGARDNPGSGEDV